MVEITTIGLDIAKSVFQVHGVGAAGQVAVRRQLRRAEVVKFFGGLTRCLVGLEACGSAHYWARQIIALGHEVRLLPPAHVKPYVKRGKKNDAADAAAICEAVGRPQMRAVPVKSAEIQGVLLLHRTRDLLVRQRTMLICALRSHLAEFGVVAGQGRGNFTKLVARLEADDGAELPELARAALRLIAVQIDDANEKVEALEKAIVTQHRSDGASRRLATILRQGAPRRHHQGRRPLSQATAGRRRHRPHPLQARERSRRPQLGNRVAGAQAGSPRHRGARQQDGAHCLGRALPRRGLSRSGSRLDGLKHRQFRGFDCKGESVT
jgi:transposase